MTIWSAFQHAVMTRACPQIERAQVHELRARIPALYVTLGTNVVAVSYTHLAVNPAWQVVGLPALILAFIILRMLWWVRLDPAQLSDAQIHQTLRTLSIAGGLIGLAVLVWALSLHDDPWSPTGITSASHSIFFVGVTFVSCIFLLMHHRFTTILICVGMVVPFTGYLLWSGRLIETAIALNVLLVSSAMLYVAVTFSRHFERSVAAAMDLVELSATNAQLAVADALTGLPNRRQFFAEIEAAGERGDPFVVVVIDLDGFKQVNDVYGHHAGDEVLRQVAARFVAVAPEHCCIARLGGDEFGCVISGALVQEAGEVAERMLAACADPVVTPTFTATVGASAGMCTSDDLTGSRASDAVREPVRVYECADYALFHAKRAGRGRVEAFNAAHRHSMFRDSTVAQQLMAAVLEHELTVVYQPIVASSDHAIGAFEALVRWNSPVLGPVAPQEFIPIAERTDLIFRISLRVLYSALLQAATWPASVRLKVNLSVRDLMSSKQTEALVAMVRLSGIEPARIMFEITETILAEAIDLVSANVDVIRAAGCKIAIDDFGVGFSSLNYIHVFAPDVIKIDRCFIAQSTTSDTTRRVIRTIVELARNVGARSVAEGVESQAEAELLAEFGCDELQGHWFSQAVSAELSTAMAVARRVDVPAARDAGRLPAPPPAEAVETRRAVPA